MDESMSTSDLIYMVEICKEAEHYEDMKFYINRVIDSLYLLNMGLDIDQRNLFSIAYKNLAGELRSSCRVLKNLEDKYENLQQKILQKSYRVNIENSQDRLCDEILGLLEVKLLPMAVQKDDYKTSLFYWKIISDFSRYICEYSEGDKLTQTKEKQESSDKNIKKILDERFDFFDPIRLGMILSTATFNYEVNGQHKTSIKQLEEFLDIAIPKLEELSDENYQDATNILKIMKDNLEKWVLDSK